MGILSQPLGPRFRGKGRDTGRVFPSQKAYYAHKSKLGGYDMATTTAEKRGRKYHEIRF